MYGIGPKIREIRGGVFDAREVGEMAQSGLGDFSETLYTGAQRSV